MLLQSLRVQYAVINSSGRFSCRCHPTEARPSGSYADCTTVDAGVLSRAQLHELEITVEEGSCDSELLVRRLDGLLTSLGVLYSHSSDGALVVPSDLVKCACHRRYLRCIRATCRAAAGSRSRVAAKPCNNDAGIRAATTYRVWSTRDSGRQEQAGSSPAEFRAGVFVRELPLL